MVSGLAHGRGQLFHGGGGFLQVGGGLFGALREIAIALRNFDRRDANRCGRGLDFLHHCANPLDRLKQIAPKRRLDPHRRQIEAQAIGAAAHRFGHSRQFCPQAGVVAELQRHDNLQR